MLFKQRINVSFLLYLCVYVCIDIRDAMFSFLFGDHHQAGLAYGVSRFTIKRFARMPYLLYHIRLLFIGYAHLLISFVWLHGNSEFSFPLLSLRTTTKIVTSQIVCVVDNGFFGIGLSSTPSFFFPSKSLCVIIIAVAIQTYIAREQTMQRKNIIDENVCMHPSVECCAMPTLTLNDSMNLNWPKMRCIVGGIGIDL